MGTRLVSLIAGIAVCLLIPLIAYAQDETPHITPDETRGRPLVDATPPRRDPDTEKIAARMLIAGNATSKLLTVINGQQLTAVHTVIEPPRSGDDPSKIYSHILVPIQKVASEDAEEFLKDIPTCDLGDGYILAGVSLTATVGPNPTVEVAILHNGDSYLNAACAAFSRPEHHIARHMRKLTKTSYMGFSLPLQIFDVEREGPNTTQFETESLSMLWARLFSDVTDNDPESLALQKYGPNYMMSIAGEMFSTNSDKFSFTVQDFDINKPTLSMPFGGVKSESLRHKLDLLNAQWFAYLKNIPLTEGNGYLNIGSDGRIAPIYKRFTVDNFGSEEFWKQLTDMDEFSGKLTCLLSLFAVDLKYIRSSELTNYAECISTYSDRPSLP
jgi:hypothetical protein